MHIVARADHGHELQRYYKIRAAPGSSVDLIVWYQAADKAVTIRLKPAIFQMCP